MKLEKLSVLTNSHYPSEKIFSFLLNLELIKSFDNLVAFNGAWMEAAVFVKGVLQWGKIDRTWSNKWIGSDFNCVLESMNYVGWAKTEPEI